MKSLSNDIPSAFNSTYNSIYYIQLYCYFNKQIIQLSFPDNLLYFMDNPKSLNFRYVPDGLFIEMVENLTKLNDYHGNILNSGNFDIFSLNNNKIGHSACGFLVHYKDIKEYVEKKVDKYNANKILREYATDCYFCTGTGATNESIFNIRGVASNLVKHPIKIKPLKFYYPPEGDTLLSYNFSSSDVLEKGSSNEFIHHTQELMSLIDEKYTLAKAQSNKYKY